MLNDKISFHMYTKRLKISSSILYMTSMNSMICFEEESFRQWINENQIGQQLDGNLIATVRRMLEKRHASAKDMQSH